LLAKVQPGDLVITQALTFVATCNAISYCNASPIFVDVDVGTLSLSPDALSLWLNENAILDSEGRCRLANTLQVIRACVPVHTFGHPAKLNELNAICCKWNLVLIEDAAESFGSMYEGRQTGTFGLFGCVSFNGNKIITGGGGGAIISNKINAMQAKHLTTTAKIPHEYEFSHDSIGYNYRLPNLNAALVLAQLKKISFFLNAKRLLAKDYENFFYSTNLKFMKEPANCKSNYWLNTIFCEDQKERDFLLHETNSQGIMTRPIWKLMCDLPMFKDCPSDGLKNSKHFQSIAINLPSGVPRHELSKLTY
jgi:dTDP-4-amino-4,6-dideoxygalactose transaminase